MGRSTSSGPDDSTARSFVRLGVPRLLARLYRYATSTLRLAAIDADHADGVEAVDLVHTLVEKGLSGTLTWTLPEDATDEEVVGYACSKLYGLRSTLRRKADLTGRDDDDALEERADQAPGALDQLVAHRMRVDIEQAFAHDAEASAYLGRMLSCHLHRWPERICNLALQTPTFRPFLSDTLSVSRCRRPTP